MRPALTVRGLGLRGSQPFLCIPCNASAVGRADVATRHQPPVGRASPKNYVPDQCVNCPGVAGADNQSAECYAYAFHECRPRLQRRPVTPEDGILNFLTEAAWFAAFNTTDDSKGGCADASSLLLL